MPIQYISDDAGNQTAVIIPIKEWNEMTAKHDDLKELVNNKSAPPKKKPSDYAGTLSKEEGEKFIKYVEQSRNEWERNF